MCAFPTADRKCFSYKYGFWASWVKVEFVLWGYEVTSYHAHYVCTSTKNTIPCFDAREKIMCCSTYMPMRTLIVCTGPDPFDLVPDPRSVLNKPKLYFLVWTWTAVLPFKSTFQKWKIDMLCLASYTIKLKKEKFVWILKLK